MAYLEFAPALQRHAAAPPVTAPAASLQSLLSTAFEQQPALQSYVLDEQVAYAKCCCLLNGSFARSKCLDVPLARTIASTSHRHCPGVELRLSVATRKGLFELSSRGGEWNVDAVHFVGEPVTATLHDPANDRAIAALRMGHFGVKLRVSADRGKNWEEVASPAYPPKPEGIEDTNSWTLDQVWIFEGFHPKQPQSLWAGTNPGGLFRSDDGGRVLGLSKAFNSPNARSGRCGYAIPGSHSICVPP